MKKIILAIAFLLLISGAAIADTSGSTFYVKDFYKISKSAISLRQNQTGANYSCGPTSLLFVKNYYWYKNFGSNSWEGRYTHDAINSIASIYEITLKKPYNSTTTTDQLKRAAKKWYWESAKASGRNSISKNLNYMKGKFKKNQPVILALEPDYDKNPLPGYAHIVVFYKYNGNTNKLYYFDPYYGGSHTIKVSEISSAIQGNLPYLRVVPWWNTKVK
jgi:hypothetical protein